MEHVDVLVVGAGSAGLAISHELTRWGIEHIVLERGRVGQAWRDRWDSFCLVTPNWTVRLPGEPYTGDDPDGYLPRDRIVAHLEGYATRSEAPVRERVEVHTIERGPDGRFVARTSAGDLGSDRVVLATGAFQRPHRPASAGSLPARLPHPDPGGHRTPSQLPPGALLIIGGALLLTGDPRALRGSGSARALAYALLTGGTIAMYTLWDKQAVSTYAIPPLLYDWARNLGLAIVVAPSALRRRADVVEHWHIHRREVIGVGVLSPLAYILVLTALSASPGSYVAPLRESGILIGTLMGTRLLAEGKGNRPGIPARDGAVSGASRSSARSRGEKLSVPCTRSKR